MLREIKKETKKKLILNAAIELFSQKGFDTVTVEEITRKAKVAKGAFYNFFKKKEDVLLFFLDQEIEKSREELQFKLAAKNNFLDQLEILVNTYLKHIYSRKEFAKVLIKERVMKMGTKKNLNENKVLDALTYIVNLAKQRNEIHTTVDSRCMAEIMHGINTMYVIFWLNGTLKSKGECFRKIKEAMTMLLQGVGTAFLTPDETPHQTRGTIE